MKKYSLGEFEELVLLIVAGMAGEAYGITIQETLSSQLSRDVQISAVHVALKRLSDKAFVRSKFGGITEERGGRRKKYYSITALGQKVLDEQYEIRTALYKKITKLSLK